MEEKRKTVRALEAVEKYRELEVYEHKYEHEWFCD